MPTPTQRRVLFAPRRFSPRDLPGLRLWLEADAITGLASTDPIDTWSDRSGYGNHATQSGGNRPTYVTNAFGTKPGVLFTIASSQYFRVDGVLPFLIGADAPHSLFAVIKLAATATIQCVFSISRSDDTGGNFIQYTMTATPQYRAHRVDATPTAVSILAGTPDTNAHVYSLLFSGTTVTLRIDGVPIIDEQAMNVGNFTSDQASIGGRVRVTPDAFFGGHKGAVLLSNQRVPLAYAIQAERYLGRKYGVVVP